MTMPTSLPMIRQQRLLLINAPYPRKLSFYGQPTSLLYACTLAVQWLSDQFGQDSSMLINYNLAKQPIDEAEYRTHLSKVISEFRPSVVAISTTTASMSDAVQIARTIKKISSEILVVIGGPHDDDTRFATATVCRYCDVSVAGDGESALLAIVKDVCEHPESTTFERQKRIESYIEKTQIYGTFRWFWRSPFGEVNSKVIRGKAKLKLDDLPPPPRKLLHPVETKHYPIFQKLDGAIKNTAQVMTQRGCIAKCAYCSESQALQRSVLLQ